MNVRRRSFPLIVAFLLALLLSSGWLGAPATPSARAQAPRVVYVFKDDTVSRDSFKALLTLRGFDVTLATVDDVTLGSVDWTNVQAVIIGDDTSNPADPYDWAGRTLPVPDNLYIIGIGLGGDGDGLDAMHMHDDLLRHQRVHRRFDRRPEPGRILFCDDEPLRLFAGRIVAFECGEQRVEIDRHHDVALVRLGEPQAGGLDPQCAALLDRSIAAGALRQQRV